jgi:hypothetical protein
MTSTDNNYNNSNKSLRESLIYDDDDERNDSSSMESSSSTTEFLSGAEWRALYLGMASGVWIQVITFAIGYYSIILGVSRGLVPVYQCYVDIVFYSIISALFVIESLRQNYDGTFICRIGFVYLIGLVVGSFVEWVCIDYFLLQPFQWSNWIWMISLLTALKACYILARCCTTTNAADETNEHHDDAKEEEYATEYDARLRCKTHSLRS